MTQAHQEAHVRRSIEDVFDFLADGSNIPAWQPFVISTTADAKSIGARSTFHQMMRHPLGYKISADYRITEYDRPFALTLVITSGGPIRSTLTYALTRVGDEAHNEQCSSRIVLAGLARWLDLFSPHSIPCSRWETSWVERARELLEMASQGVGV
jgi:hypothetical protein